jgi:hypothetical protein
VQWKHFGVDEATWDMEDAMRLAYPFFLLYNCKKHGVLNTKDNVSLRGRGI